jgi:hypothetical protein
MNMNETERVNVTLWLPKAVHDFLNRPAIRDAYEPLQEIFLDGVRAFLDAIDGPQVRDEAAACSRLIDQLLTKREGNEAASKVDEQVDVCFKVPKPLLTFVTNYCAFAKEDLDTYLKDALIAGVQSDALAISGPMLGLPALVKKYDLSAVFT